ncbi:hypothetical protein Ae201684_016660 [Aphanomyces euteiches]|uniref:Uncharacterized protein n=1 Tax=Aphanomyces euteiches TaxID=100861 RepID=A0A6G0WC13_9STRA|nr:hypothetical protein Ae201684_016660 [Aphanomyces euteiches]
MSMSRGSAKNGLACRGRLREARVSMRSWLVLRTVLSAGRAAPRTTMTLLSTAGSWHDYFGRTRTVDSRTRISGDRNESKKESKSKSKNKTHGE